MTAKIKVVHLIVGEFFFCTWYGLVNDLLSSCKPLKLTVSKHPHVCLGERVMLRIRAFVGEPHQSREQ